MVERKARRRSAVAAAVLALGAFALGACGSGGGGTETAAGSTPTGSDAGALGTIEVISTDVGLGKGATTSFTAAKTGDRLAVGDRVQTNPSGFAEVGYFDGSWMRIENSNVLTMVELSDTESGQVVHTAIDGGRAWARVQKLTESGDRFELDTPVAQATVRGTAFSVDCPTVDRCIFTVVEGTVTVTPTGGAGIDVTAGHQLSVTKDQVPGSPDVVSQSAIDADPWLAKNLARDRAKGVAPSTPDTTELAGASVPCVGKGTVSGDLADIELTAIHGTLDPQSGTNVQLKWFPSGSADPGAIGVGIGVNSSPNAPTSASVWIYRHEGPPDPDGAPGENGETFTNLEPYDASPTREPIAGSVDHIVFGADGSSVTITGLQLVSEQSTRDRTVTLDIAITCGPSPTGDAAVVVNRADVEFATFDTGTSSETTPDPTAELPPETPPETVPGDLSGSNMSEG